MSDEGKSIAYQAAQEYRNAPLVDPMAVYSWASLGRDVGRLYEYVKRKGVVMDAQPEWRYQSYDNIRKDVEQGRIYRALDFYPHPVWDWETQALFRVVHDYFHYETNLDITIEGEYEIVTKHHRLQFSTASYPAIVAEIYHQAAYSLVFGEFGPNKIFIPQMALKEHLATVQKQATTWDWSRADTNAVLTRQQIIHERRDEAEQAPSSPVRYNILA